jgi:tripartite-type tricarboxylate transporter receptor subunit TctC
MGNIARVLAPLLLAVASVPALADFPSPAKESTAIGLTAVAPILIVARVGFPPRSLMDVADYARKYQDTGKDVDAGVGSQSHTVCMARQSIINTRTPRVAYRGLVQVINDLVAGHVDGDFACGDIGSSIAQLQAALKAIAIARPRDAAHSALKARGFEPR